MDQNIKLAGLLNGRLGSLSLPRDLTLGAQKSRKVYKPNVNVVRKKDNIETTPATPNRHNSNRRNESKPYQRKERNKQNNNAKSGRYVQLQGVFSEGCEAQTKPPSIRSDRYSSHYNSDRDTTVIEAPTIVKNSWNVDVKAEEDVLKELLCMDEEESDEDDIQFAPCVLPLGDNQMGFFKYFNVKKEVKVEIKKEPLDGNLEYNLAKALDDDSSGSGSVKMENGPVVPPIKQEITSSLFNGIKKYDDEDLSISLIKMPDSLPGKGFVPQTDEPADYTLDQMVEGQIGKLLLRRSGNIDIVIGNSTYHLDPEDPPGFIEDVMAMPPEEKEKTAPSNSNRDSNSIVHLTSITDRFVLVPSWESFFLQGRIKKKD